MSPEAQRIAIAEACGTHRVTWGEKCATLIDKNGVQADFWWSAFEGLPRGYAANHGFVFPPDFLNDLNAIHEAEKVLTVQQQHIYLGELNKQQNERARATGDWRHLNAFWAAHATAAQRAEAFLRTLGKWEEKP